MKENSSKIQSGKNVLLPAEHPKRVHHWNFRVLKDKWARYVVTIGGNSVIVAILLIFFYLIYETAPLLKGADIEILANYSLNSNIDNEQQKLNIGKESYYALEEQGEIAAKFDRVSGHITFFETKTGQIKKEYQLAIPTGEAISSFYAADPESGVVAYGLSNGQVMILKHGYIISYHEEQRLITPEVMFPMGEIPLVMDSLEQRIKHIAFQQNDEETTIVALTQDKRLLLSHYINTSPLIYSDQFYLNNETVLAKDQSHLKRIDSKIRLSEFSTNGTIKQLLFNKAQTQFIIFYIDETGRSVLDVFSIKDKKQPKLIQQLILDELSNPVTTISYLTGDISILVGQKNGRISQWFPIKQDDGPSQFKAIREFNEQQAPIIQIVSEVQRKGFVAVDKQGVIGIYHTTAEKNLLLEQISQKELSQIALSPRANYLLTLDNDFNAIFWAVDNEHPEISWHSIWNKVWYESYSQAEYIWQSSSASNDFEPKFSLSPLVFGTLKAAFYAMLFAIPLAIMGAIYTAYFMSSKARGFVKPSIEIMEALPTVILGFLAGLWLAPLVENNLPAVFSLLLVLPVSVLMIAWIWHLLPQSVRQEIPDGWEAFILLPIIILATWGTFALSLPMEKLFFDGDMQSWISNELGVGFNQRNAIVVGIAMGFAVIPTIFSITEDAIFSVPKHLTLGSLALGATRWQTLINVVILTASPAIFSAVMIGCGRAIGETMIVLMATGNTPVMDFNLFEGMRTLSANIAIEIPESEVASSHFRILFLAALILFIFTFMFNTIAELIRQRLRQKYSSL
ncbi:MAG: ABC transporter permease subunit [Gammaproteobacteria bacterium]|nr:ABC transporter permease subunit [Gammaproteobacteria bacterium]